MNRRIMGTLLLGSLAACRLDWAAKDTDVGRMQQRDAGPPMHADAGIKEEQDAGSKADSGQSAEECAGTEVDCASVPCEGCHDAGPRCAGDSDCAGGQCVDGACTAPSYAWKASPFGACDASSCSVGSQTRRVWCERDDGAEVDDSLCPGDRPEQGQLCTNTAGCSWHAEAYGACSARCGGGTQSRPVSCRSDLGVEVPWSWCPVPPPPVTASCNAHPCTVYVVGEPSASMGPCWSPPHCHGGYPAFPECPQGYVATRSETACGNPNFCGDNWALCTFAQTVHYGCLDATYVMGVATRECTYQ